MRPKTVDRRPVRLETLHLLPRQALKAPARRPASSTGGCLLAASRATSSANFCASSCRYRYSYRGTPPTPSGCPPYSDSISGRASTNSVSKRACSQVQASWGCKLFIAGVDAVRLLSGKMVAPPLQLACSAPPLRGTFPRRRPAAKLPVTFSDKQGRLKMAP